MSVLMNPQPQPQPTEPLPIQYREIPLDESRPITGNVSVIARFYVPLSGSYVFSEQLAILADTKCKLSYIQFGICKPNQTDIERVFFSQIYNTDIHANELITNTLTSVVQLESDTEYECWVNVNSSVDCIFKHEFSSVKLYRL